MKVIFESMCHTASAIMFVVICYSIYDINRSFDVCKNIMIAKKQQQCVLKTSRLK